MLADFDKEIYGKNARKLSKVDIFDEYVLYMQSKESQGYELSRMLKHMFGLSKGDKHAKTFRRLVLEAIKVKDISPYHTDLRSLLIN